MKKGFYFVDSDYICYLKEKEIEARGFVLSFGNNLAYQSQQKGYLKTYPWSVSFDDNRRWPWHVGSQLVR